MIKQYYNSQGRITIIEDMSDPHLVNSYLKYSANVAELEIKTKDNPILGTAVHLRLKAIKEIQDSLGQEIKARGLKLPS